MRIDILKRLKSGWQLTIKAKLVLSISAIAVTLLLSSIISIVEFRAMNTYVSGLISENVNNVSIARRLSDVVGEYNLDVLAVIGDDKLTRTPDFDAEAFVNDCDSLKNSLERLSLQTLVDSVLYSYSAYMLTSTELQDVYQSDFIDSRIWYFERLQTRYRRLTHDIEELDAAIFNDLSKNSETFDRGFYRSVIPSMVAVGIGLLLLFLLLFFIVAYYVKPLYGMLSAMENYKTLNRKYTYAFDGDDQLSMLNDGITRITAENIQLKRRISALKLGQKSKMSDI